MKNLVRRFVNKLGIDIVRYPSPVMKSLATILESNEINLILDVGANDGWYSRNLRNIGYKNKIVSFEPLQEPYIKILAYANRNPTRHKVLNFALGEFDGTAKIHVSQNSVSSSMLDATPALLSAASEAKYIQEREVKIHKLDTIISSVYNPLTDKVFLKLDVQGYEKNVLNGAQDTLKHIFGIQLETAFHELYMGEMLFHEMLPYLQSLGFELHLIMPGFMDVNSGRMLEADCIFIRPNAPKTKE